MPKINPLCFLLFKQCLLVEDERLSCKEQAEKIIKFKLIGAYVPSCRPDGHYSPLQCHGSTGICWCADKNGQRVPDNLVQTTKCSML